MITWYATELLKVDGKVVKKCVCLDKYKKGGTFDSDDPEPGNTCETEFDGEVEYCVYWFESLDIARDFIEGKVTWQETREKVFYKLNNTTMYEFRKREIIPVEGNVKPYECHLVVVDNGKTKDRL